MEIQLAASRKNRLAMQPCKYRRAALTLQASAFGDAHDVVRPKLLSASLKPSPAINEPAQQ
jgi:hypothetical protein